MKDYSIGYVTGVSGLFRIGYLNLIGKSEEKRKYLIAGVLTDELVVRFKRKKPYIPFEERLEVTGALKYVDKTVDVTTSNIDKVATWELYKFDCPFSGDDYANNESWVIDRKRLNQVGADIHFSPCTRNTSSTQIKEAMGRKRCFRMQE